MNTQRKIIHIDADSFYASVEIRDNPKLANLPVAVGGSPNSRGVIATCNYIAREYGVRSAMASSQALKLCPELVFVKPNFPQYKKVSQQIREIMLRYTDIIEPLSLDEAYLDVSASTHCQGSATLIAESIRTAVQKELNLSVSAGVAPNKFLAKVASDWNKPNGLWVIKPDDVESFVRDLPVNKINGVGKVTTQKLKDMGITTCADLQTVSLEELNKRFGKYGRRLFDYARGIDERSLQTSRERKSLSVEHTYDRDIIETKELEQKAKTLFEELTERAKKLPPSTRIHKRVVKIKFSDFTQTTLEETLPSGQTDWADLNEYLRMTINARSRSDKSVRLLGMGVKIFTPNKNNNLSQLGLFPSNL